MPISKRRLTKWRKEALKTVEFFLRDPGGMVQSEVNCVRYAHHIISLTQELLDQQLLKEK
jgi:hypothetical protein